MIKESKANLYNMKVKEITVDWDDCFDNPSNFLDFSEKQDRLKVFIEENDNISEIFWRYSSRGKGIHLKIILKRQVSVLENFMYRAQLEDDIYRIKADLVRYASGKEINRLWDAKIVKGEEFYAGEWRKFKN